MSRYTRALWARRYKPQGNETVFRELNVSLTVHHELITQNTNVMHLILFIR